MIGAQETGIAIEHGEGNTIAANTVTGGRVGIHLFTRNDSLVPSRDYRVDDNVIVEAERGIVLEHTAAVRLRGNLLDRDGIGLVTDSAGAGTTLSGNIFARPGKAYIQAPGAGRRRQLLGRRLGGGNAGLGAGKDQPHALEAGERRGILNGRDQGPGTRG